LTRLYLRQEAVLDWSEGVYDPDKFGTGNGGTGFEANQVVWRAELRGLASASCDRVAS
jgi:hypothetical protein